MLFRPMKIKDSTHAALLRRIFWCGLAFAVAEMLATPSAAQHGNSACGPFPQMTDYGFKVFTGDGSSYGEKSYMRDKKLWMECMRSSEQSSQKSKPSRPATQQVDSKECWSFIIANGVKKCL
jgi:hypothetical protein